MSQWAAGPGKQGSNAWLMLLLLGLPSRCCLRRRQHGCTTLDHSLPRSSAQVRACMKPFITFAAWWQWTFGTYWPQITGHSKWKLTTTVTVGAGAWVLLGPEDTFSLVLPDPWLLQSFCLLFYSDPWAQGKSQERDVLSVDEHCTVSYSPHFD